MKLLYYVKLTKMERIKFNLRGTLIEVPNDFFDQYKHTLIYQLVHSHSKVDNNIYINKCPKTIKNHIGYKTRIVFNIFIIYERYNFFKGFWTFVYINIVINFRMRMN